MALATKPKTMNTKKTIKAIRPFASLKKSVTKRSKSLPEHAKHVPIKKMLLEIFKKGPRVNSIIIITMNTK